MRAPMFGAVLALLILPSADGAVAQKRGAREISSELRSELGSISSYAGQAATFQARLGQHNDLDYPNLTKLEDAERWVKVSVFCLEKFRSAYAAGAVAEHEIHFGTRDLAGDDGPLKSPLSVAQAERFCAASRALAEAHVRDVKAITDGDAARAGEIPGLGAEALAQLAGRFASAAAQGLSRLGVNDHDRPDMNRIDDTEHWRNSSGLCLLHAERAAAAGFDATRAVPFKTYGARLNEIPVSGSLNLMSLREFCQASMDAAMAQARKLRRR
ncbi:MAG: hypothetical protein KIT81_11645 [Alphaproteobacteria bacterium]|nr:hypothetical protein [Alphaproteobacteria bacterium]